MKFCSNTLKLAVKQAMRATGSSAMPILKGIRCKADETGLEMMTTDLERMLRISVPAENGAEARFVLDGEVLAGIVGKLPEDSVSLEASKKGDRVKIQCGRATWDLNTMPYDDFPVEPALAMGKGAIEINTVDLKRAVHQTCFASLGDRDVTRLALAGVWVEFEAGRMTLVATDGYRMSVSTIDAASEQVTQRNKLVMAKHLEDLHVLLLDTGVPVIQMYCDSLGLVFVADEEWVYHVRYMEEEYPDWRRVVPGDSLTRIYGERKALLAALARCEIFTPEESGAVVLSDEGGRLMVSSHDVSKGSAKEVTGWATANMPKLTVCAKYVIEALKHLESEQVALMYRDAGSAMLLVGEDADAGYRHVIMPIRGD